MTDENKITVEVPDGAFVNCPLRHGGLVSLVSVCIKCDHFKGLIDVKAPEDRAFEVRNRVCCGMPRALEITVAEMG